MIHGGIRYLENGELRLVQESVSFVYADHGDTWIDEHSPLDINAATAKALAEQRAKEAAVPAVPVASSAAPVVASR